MRDFFYRDKTPPSFKTEKPMIKLNEQYIGNFWNPCNPKERTFGVLEVSDSGVFLKCYGEIFGAEYMMSDINFHKPLEIINGECREFMHLSIVFLKLYDFRISGKRKEIIYKAELVVLGDTWIKDLKQTNITYSMVTYHAMENFAKKQMLSIVSGEKNETIITLAQTPNVEIHKSKTLHTYLFCRYNISYVNNPKSDFLNGDYFWNTEHIKNISLLELLHFKDTLNGFFSIILSEHLTPKSFDFNIGEYELHLFSSNLLVDRNKAQKYSSIRKPAVTLKDLEDVNFLPFVKWINNYYLISNSVSLYLDAVRSFSQLTLENYFLNLFYANETLLREMFPEIKSVTKIPKDIESLISKYDMRLNDANKLRSKFSKPKANTLDYFKMISEILPNLVLKLFGADFINSLKMMKDTRDRIVHENGLTSKIVIENDEDLKKYSNALRIMFQSLCLYYMGFGKSSEVFVFNSRQNNIS